MSNFEKFLTYEDREHIRVVNYIKDKLPDIIAFHSPNESKKSAFERFKFSLMGALKGCPDFVFVFPKYKTNVDNDTITFTKDILYHGLFIELKAPEHNRIVQKGKNEGKIVKAKGKLSPEQANVLKRLNEMGYKAVCCFGADEAINIIDDYFAEYFYLQKQLNPSKIKKIVNNITI